MPLFIGDLWHTLSAEFVSSGESVSLCHKVLAGEIHNSHKTTRTHPANNSNAYYLRLPGWNGIAIIGNILIVAIDFQN